MDIEKIEVGIKSLKASSENPFLEISDVENIMAGCQEYFSDLIEWFKGANNADNDAEDINCFCMDYIFNYRNLSDLYDDMYTRKDYMEGNNYEPV